MPGFFGKDDRRRIASATKRVEQMPLALPRPPALANVEPGANLQYISVSSSTPIDTLMGVAYLPGRPQIYDPSAGTWSDKISSDTVAVFDPAGGTPSDKVWAVEVDRAIIPVATPADWPTFAVLSGGGGGDDYALLDAVAGDGTPYYTDLTNSVCFYSAKRYSSWNPAGGTNQGLTFTTPIWLFFVYNPIVYNDTSPGTPVKLDGHSVHKCKFTGQSYEVVTGLGSQGSRPVYFATEIGWAWRVDCSGSGPPATENEG